MKEEYALDTICPIMSIIETKKCLGSKCHFWIRSLSSYEKYYVKGTECVVKNYNVERSPMDLYGRCGLIKECYDKDSCGRSNNNK